MVNTAYVTGIREALEKDGRFALNGELNKIYEDWLEDHHFDMGAGWAGEPWYQEEMPVSRELAENVRKESDTAVIIIGRTAGEDKDNLAAEGSYLLTKTEEEMLTAVCSVFERTVVLLNVGNIIDMKWVEKYRPGAVLYVWQGGQEGGVARSPEAPGSGLVVVPAGPSGIFHCSSLLLRPPAGAVRLKSRDIIAKKEENGNFCLLSAIHFLLFPHIFSNT